MNNTEYICASIGANDMLSDPAYIIIAGEQYATYLCMQAHEYLKSDCKLNK